MHTHSHIHTAALLQSPCYCLLTAAFFFSMFSNLSSPAKICFLSPFGSVYTDTTFQLAEEKQTENWVDKSEELLTVKCFTRWLCSFSPPLLPSLHFFFMYLFFFPWCFYELHITQLLVTTLLFSLWMSLGDNIAVSKSQLVSDYQVCSITVVACLCTYVTLYGCKSEGCVCSFTYLRSCHLLFLSNVQEQCPGELNTVIKLEPFLMATRRSRNHCAFMKIDGNFRQIWGCHYLHV